VLPSSSGGGKVLSFDNSCTIPSNSFLHTGVDFVNFAYTGTADDGGGSGLDRTKEGYVEIIEMATYFTNSCTSIQVTHSGGVPKDCAHVKDSTANSEAEAPSGGLFGGMSLINVAAGTDYTEDAVALANFNTSPLYNNAGSVSPQLTDADAFSIVLGANSLNRVTFSSWPHSNPNVNFADPVSAVLMHDQVMNEYILDAATKSGTDWVVTFPTKRFYVNPGTGLATKLFQRNFNDSVGSCDDITLTIYDREEKTTSTPVTFSPPPPTPGSSICWEANIITFNNSNLLGSVNKANINTGNANGWLNLTFNTASLASGTVTDPSRFHTLINQSQTSHVGLSVATLVVGGSNVLSNYGGNFVHKTTTTIFC
jgi:hypothetical protein